MDLKSLISKLDSMEAPPQTPSAPELPKSVQLDEDIAMHVLAGTKTLTEAADLMEKKLTAAEKEKKEEVVKSMKKDKEGFEKRYGDRGEEVMHATATKIAKKKAESVESTEEAIAEDESVEEVFDADEPVGTKKKTQHGTATKTATGMKHERGAPASSDDEDDEDAPKSKKKKKNENIDTDAFKSKFLKMVEEAKKDDKKDDKKKSEKKSGMDLATLRAAAKTAKPVKDMTEAKKPDEDGDGVPDWADKKPGEDDNADKKKSGKKEMSAKQAKYFGKKNESKMMPKGKKRPVKESFEPKLTFKDMVKLVQESGGQQQIDALDKELFAWANRVAQKKLGEGMKAEVYAGLVYERMGGRFEMYDVLAETKK